MLYLYSAGLTPRAARAHGARSRESCRISTCRFSTRRTRCSARMRRPERQTTIREKVARIREVVPDVAIRTTCIVGFPGETEEDFETLLAFLEEMQFDRVGAFTYSPQEGTRAAEMDDDVPDDVKRERLERLNELQRHDHRRSGTSSASDARCARSSIVSTTRRRAGANRVAGRRHRRRHVRDRRATDLAPGTFIDVRARRSRGRRRFRRDVRAASYRRRPRAPKPTRRFPS